MKDHLTIHLNIDWRVLIVMGVTLAVFVFFNPGASAQGSAPPVEVSSQSAYTHLIRAEPVRLAASSGSGTRRFYVTNSYRIGNQPLTSCTTGFHMASFWELLDVSNLSYAGDLPDAATRNDAGNGPPSGLIGWVRTGYDSSDSSTVGTGNCENWSTSSDLSHGTAIRLTNTWQTPPDPVGLWSVESYACNISVRVWCVED